MSTQILQSALPDIPDNTLEERYKVCQYTTLSQEPANDSEPLYDGVISIFGENIYFGGQFLLEGDSSPRHLWAKYPLIINSSPSIPAPDPTPDPDPPTTTEPYTYTFNITNFLTNGPAMNASVKVYGTDDTIIGNGSTNNDGTCSINLQYEPSHIIITQSGFERVIISSGVEVKTKTFIVTLGTEYSNLRVQTDYRIIPTIYYQGSEVKQYTVSQYQSWVEDSNKNIYVPGNLSNTTYVYNENGGLTTSVDSFEVNSGWPSYINIFVNEHEHNMNYGPILIPYDPEVDRNEEIEMEFNLNGCASWIPSND